MGCRRARFEQQSPMGSATKDTTTTTAKYRSRTGSTSISPTALQASAPQPAPRRCHSMISPCTKRSRQERGKPKLCAVLCGKSRAELSVSMLDVDTARAKFSDQDMARRKADETRSLQPPRSLRQQLAPHIHVQLLSQQLRCAPYDILPKLKAALHLQPALQRPRLRLPRHHCDRYRRQPRPRQVHYPQLPHALHLHPPTAAQALRA